MDEEKRKQTGLFGDPVIPKDAYNPSVSERKTQTTMYQDKDGSPITAWKREENIKYPNERCLKTIANDPYLWDMRAWDTRTREEAEAWVQNLTSKNCGHVVFCIRILRGRGYPDEKIVDAIMSNTKIEFKNRLIRCFGASALDFNAPRCERWTEEKGYSGTDCEKCR